LKPQKATKETDQAKKAIAGKHQRCWPMLHRKIQGRKRKQQGTGQKGQIEIES